MSTDYGQTKTTFPNLPYGGIQYGCVVIVNETTAFVAGGYGSSYDNCFSDTFYLNLETKAWSRGPSLSDKRVLMSCNLITKPYRGIVIIGGENKEGGTNTVEILNLETNEMTAGKEIFSCTQESLKSGTETR